MKALLITCVFNEGPKIEKTAAQIAHALSHRTMDPPVDVLIVDDGSTDGAAEKAAALHGFAYLRNAERKGVGYSIRMAYQYGLDRQYVILATIAGNSKDNPEELDRIIQPIAANEADFVQGSRYLPGGKYGNLPLYRLFATRFLHPFLFFLATGKKITDTTNGFRALRTSMLRDSRINWKQDWLNHYELEPYLFYKATKLGYYLIEVPVTKIYPDKKLGYSKIPPITGWWSLIKPLLYLALGIRK